jgi:hypothetical protein
MLPTWCWSWQLAKVVFVMFLPCNVANVSICNSLIKRGWESFHMLTCLLHMSAQIFCPLKNCLFHYYWVLRILYIFCIQVILSGVCRYFLLLCSLYIHFKCLPLNFSKILLIKFSSTDCVLVPKNLPPNPQVHTDFSVLLFSESFTV